MTTTYSSLRIYLTGSRNTLEQGFYDVIGYYGDELQLTDNKYVIDITKNYPVIRQSINYYYLNYDNAYGYFPVRIDEFDKLHLLIDDVTIPIYQYTQAELNASPVLDDNHLLTSGDYPINANITISGIEFQRIAYRTYDLHRYDAGYAIKVVGPIVDNSSIIDSIDSDFNLIPTNADGIIINPSPDKEGLEGLFHFELTYNKNIKSINRDAVEKIALYSADTKAIIVGVDANSFPKTILGENIVEFNLLAEVTNSGTYFLYLPTGLMTYEDGSLSSIAMFAYTIVKPDDEGDKTELVYEPSQGIELSTIKFTFPNIRVIEIDISKNVTVKAFGQSKVFNFNTLLSNSINNTFTLDFTKQNEIPLVNNSTVPVVYTITFPENTFEYATSYYNSKPIDVEYTLLPSDSDLPEIDPEEITIEYSPEDGSEVYGVSYVNVKFSANKRITVSPTQGRFISEVVLIDSEGNNVAHASNLVKLKSDNNSALYKIEFNKAYKTDSSYQIAIPAGLFAITTKENGTSVTNYNSGVTLNYTIKVGNPEAGEFDGSTVSFYYGLINLFSDTVGYGSELATKVDDTICINIDKLKSITLTPVLSVTHYDPNNPGVEIKKELFEITAGNKMSVNIRGLYYNENNVPVELAVFKDYSYKNGKITSYDLLNEVFLELGKKFPKYLKITFLFTYNTKVLKYECELQFLPDDVYQRFLTDPNAIIRKTIDLYSGEEVETQYGCLLLTNHYDSIVSKEEDDTVKYYTEILNHVRTRVGNLAGIYNAKFKNSQPQGYGLYGENVYLTGNFFLNNGKSLVDISNDVLLAVGDVNHIKESFERLDASVKATIDALTTSQEQLISGLDSTIENFVSTNKNSVLKIGLDYSLWALGNAGISLINPNATYKVSPETGEYSVDPNTVGDGDEYISLQGSSIHIKTNMKEQPRDEEGKVIVNSDGSVDTYNVILCTTENPKSWKYQDRESIFVPYTAVGDFENPDDRVPFFKAYIKNFSSTDKVDSSNKSFLRFVSFNNNDLKYNSTFYPENFNSSDIFDSYSFSSFYYLPKDSGEIMLKVWEVGEDINKNYYLYEDYEKIEGAKIVFKPYNEIYPNQALSTIYYVPIVNTAGLFENGKFNADFIEAEKLFVVDTNHGYIKNPNFNIDEDIAPGNYPVLNAEGQEVKDAPYVVISGKTGKITARYADIRGSIIIGEEAEQHIKITDNVPGSEDAENVLDGPAMYIKDNTNVLAKFSAKSEQRPLDQFKRGDQVLIYSPLSISGTASASYSVERQIYTSRAVSESVYGDVNCIQKSLTPYSDLGNHSNLFFTLASNESIILDVSINRTMDFSNKHLESIKTIPYILSGDLKLEVVPNGSGNPTTILSTHGSYTHEVYVANNDSSNPYLFDDWVDKPYNLSDSQTTTKIKFTNTTSNSVTYYLNTVFQAKLSTYATYDLYNYHKVYNPNDPSYDYDNSLNNGSYTEERGSFFEEATKMLPALVNISGNFNMTINSVKIIKNNYTAAFMGNGLVLGYNSNNYFGTYFNNEGTTKDQMTFDFQSGGSGMKFEDGNMYNYIKGNAIKAFVPVLQGRIYCVLNGNDGYNYTFRGISAVSTSEWSWDSYSRPTIYENNKTKASYVPYFSNAYEDKFWGKDIDHRGSLFNTQVLTGSDYVSSTKHNITYDSMHDLYLVSVEEGRVVLIFGDKWFDLFGDNFCVDSRLFIQANGCGLVSSQTTYGYAPYGPLYVTVKGLRGNVSGEKAGTSKTNMTLDKGLNADKQTTPLVRGWIQFETADDSSLNSGDFLVTVSYCPN